MLPLVTLLQIGCLIALAGLLVAAAWQDLRTLRIGNGFSISIAAVFVVWATAGLVAGTFTLPFLGFSVACAGGLFLLGAAAFAVGMIGGGDVKLLAAVGLFAGPALVIDLLLITALAGGLMGLAVLAGAPIGAVSMEGEATLRQRLRGRVPYGPAIAVAGLWVATRLAVG